VWGDYPENQLIFAEILDVRQGEEVHINEGPLQGKAFQVKTVSHHFCREEGVPKYVKTLILE
jgi:hypothetical protein